MKIYPVSLTIAIASTNAKEVVAKNSHYPIDLPEEAKPSPSVTFFPTQADGDDWQLASFEIDSMSMSLGFDVVRAIEFDSKSSKGGKAESKGGKTSTILTDGSGDGYRSGDTHPPDWGPTSKASKSKDGKSSTGSPTLDATKLSLPSASPIQAPSGDGNGAAMYFPDWGPEEEVVENEIDAASNDKKDVSNIEVEAKVEENNNCSDETNALEVLVALTKVINETGNQQLKDLLKEAIYENKNHE